MKQSFIQGFRHATPYINAHRNRTFVIAMSGAAVVSENFKQLVQDIAALHSLGIRIVLIHGFRQQIDSALQAQNIESQFHQGLRITDKQTLDLIQQIAGQTRIQIEAAFSMGLANSPLYGGQLTLCSGNFVSAKPMGILDGVDMQLTGSVRKIDSATIIKNLTQQQIVLLSTLAYASTAEVFNLSLYELATATAKHIQADKLIFLQKEEGMLDENGFLIRHVNCKDKNKHIQSSQQKLYQSLCEFTANPKSRAHVLSYQQDGALLQELFTHLGAGTLISHDAFEIQRQANRQDVNAIIELITPFEEQGILIKRSREQLEQEVEHFTVIECDQRIIACAALYPYKNSAEIACIVTHPEYQKKGLASQLLTILEQKATQLGCTQLFVLSTQTTHWFIEHGFQESHIDDLPAPKKDLYNYSRNSKVLIKKLSQRLI